MIQNPFDSAAEKTRQQKEFALQCHIVDKHRRYFPHIIMTAFPGRPGDAQDGFFKKMMGVLPGVTDILLWWNNGGIQAGVIEIKVDAGVSSSQNKFMSAIRNVGGKDGVARSWQQYYELLCKWGITPKEKCLTFDEPDLRSDAQKKSDAFAFFLP